jgi:hypothetical protein
LFTTVIHETPANGSPVLDSIFSATTYCRARAAGLVGATADDAEPSQRNAAAAIRDATNIENLLQHIDYLLCPMFVSIPPCPGSATPDPAK